MFQLKMQLMEHYWDTYGRQTPDRSDISTQRYPDRSDISPQR